MKSALVTGATGLVGEALVQQLLQNSIYKSVELWVRKDPGIKHPKLHITVIPDWNAASVLPEKKFDDVFCALGTTIATAKTQERFREIEVSIPVAIARAVKQAGARKFIYVSALGADRQSNIFYNRCKGEIEAELSNLKFPVLLILRPSLLLGNRKEFRAGELFFRKVSEPFRFLVPKLWRPIHASEVARAMIYYANGNLTGNQILENDRLFV